MVTASKVESSKGRASADASANSRETLLPAEEKLQEVRFMVRDDTALDECGGGGDRGGSCECGVG